MPLVNVLGKILNGKDFVHIQIFVLASTSCLILKLLILCFFSDWGYRSDDYNGGTCVLDVNFSEDHINRPCSSG